MSELNIFQKMLKIQSDMQTVEKGLRVVTNTSKGTGYQAVSERDVKDAVKPLEEKYGVYSYPVSSEVIDSGILDNNDRKSHFMRIRETYRFVNVDKPTEFVEVSAFGDGIDSGDKAPGKADTYAGKYALMKAYKISTGDDPDKEACPEETKASDKQIEYLKKLYKEEELAKITAYYKISSIEELSKDVISKYINDRSNKNANN